MISRPWRVSSVTWTRNVSELHEIQRGNGNGITLGAACTLTTLCEDRCHCAWCKRSDSLRCGIQCVIHDHWYHIFPKMSVGWILTSLQSLKFWCRHIKIVCQFPRGRIYYWSTTLPLSHSRSLKLLPKNIASWQLWWSIWNWHLDFFFETSKREWSTKRFPLWSLMFGLYQGSTPTSERCRKLGTSTFDIVQDMDSGNLRLWCSYFFNSTMLDVFSQCEAGNVMIAKTHPDFPSDICLLLSTLNAKPESQQVQHFSSEYSLGLMNTVLLKTKLWFFQHRILSSLVGRYFLRMIILRLLWGSDV